MRQSFIPAALLAACCTLSPVTTAGETFDITRREVIDMPPLEGAALKGEMVDLLSAMRQVYALAGENRYLEAGDLAEKLVGQTAMDRHTDAFPPQMFMPTNMRVMAQALNRRGTDWAFALRTGDRSRADTAFGQLLATCSACHHNFQLRNR